MRYYTPTRDRRYRLVLCAVHLICVCVFTSVCVCMCVCVCVRVLCVCVCACVCVTPCHVILETAAGPNLPPV